jgi:hypothetical protein
MSGTLCDSAWIFSVVSNRRPFRFKFICGNRKKSHGAKSGEYGGWGMTATFYFARNCWVRTECETGCCRGEAIRSVLAKVRSDVLAGFHAVAAKRRSRTRNLQFGLLRTVFALPQLLCRWRHQSGIFWIARISRCPVGFVVGFVTKL